MVNFWGLAKDITDGDSLRVEYEPDTYGDGVVEEGRIVKLTVKEKKQVWFTDDAGRDFVVDFDSERIRFSTSDEWLGEVKEATVV